MILMGWLAAPLITVSLSRTICVMVDIAVLAAPNHLIAGVARVIALLRATVKRGTSTTIFTIHAMITFNVALVTMTNMAAQIPWSGSGVSSLSSAPSLS